MANTNKAFGFRPVGANGAGYDTQGLTSYPISANYATSIFQGDVVTLASGYLAAGTTSGAIVGVFVGCNYTDPTTGKPTWSNKYVQTNASDIVAMVADNPNQLFVVQCSGIAAATCIGRNAQVDTGTSGNTTTGVSGQQVGVPATGNATYTFKVVGVYEADGNNDVTSAYADLIVAVNNHLYKGGTGTAGV